MTRKLKSSLSRVLLLMALLVVTLKRAHARDWRSRQRNILKGKSAKAGWKRVKSKSFRKENKELVWERIDLPADSGLRVGVKHRPRLCPTKSKSGDYLAIHYNGTLYSDGSLFDSSILREEPFVFQIGKEQMIEGWEKGLLNMCVGEKRKLIVPSNFAYGITTAYGSEAMTSKVKPGSTIVYNVELLEILNEEAAAPHLVWGL